MNYRQHGSDGIYKCHGESDETDNIPACPFCESEDVENSNTHTPYYSVRCEDCGAEGPTSVLHEDEEVEDSDPDLVLAQHQKAAAHAIHLWSQAIR